MPWRGKSGRVARTAALVALSLVVALAAGCGGGEPTTTGPETSSVTTAGTVAPSDAPTKIAIIAPEKANDFGWNQQGVESAEAIAQELGASIEVSDGAGYEDISPIYRQLVANGADWMILWASGYNTAGIQLAQETGVKTVVIGLFDDGLVPGLVTDFETDAQQGAYLAGVVAARTSKSGTLGIVASSSIDENWNKMAGGFIAGAKAARADIKIEYAPVGESAYADAASAKRVTETVIAAGADIILGMGDGSTFGMIQAVENATPPKGSDKVWFIDVIGDKSSIDTKGVLLTSIVWDYLPIFRAAVADMEAGRYGTQVGYLDLENGGIRLLQSDRISAEAWTAAETAKQAIIGGSVSVPEIYTVSEIKELLK
jgi:basic membrane protein A